MTRDLHAHFQIIATTGSLGVSKFQDAEVVVLFAALQHG
jgi:hypothetical protein